MSDRQYSAGKLAQSVAELAGKCQRLAGHPPAVLVFNSWLMQFSFLLSLKTFSGWLG